jgi:hypothetical protein
MLRVDARERGRSRKGIRELKSESLQPLRDSIVAQLLANPNTQLSTPFIDEMVEKLIQSRVALIEQHSDKSISEYTPGRGRRQIKKLTEEARDIMERASVLKKKISKSRDEQLANKGGEFSVENLVFKKLRNEGWIGKLIDIKAQAYSRIYSEPTGAVDSEFSTEADVIDESLVGKGSMVLVLGPKVEGAKRLFLFHADWSRQVERNGWTVNMVGLTTPVCIIQEQDGRLVAKTISISPGNLKKYAGLTDYNVVLNSKTKTPFWHQAVKYTNAASLLKDLSANIRSIPEVTFN